MTLLEEINGLTWFNEVNKLKSILRRLLGFERPYKVYTAILSQTGTGTPTATVLENTLGFTPTLSRTATGVYYVTSNGAFLEEKTVVFITTKSANLVLGATSKDVSPDSIIITQKSNVDNTPTDTLVLVAIEIRIYN